MNFLETLEDRIAPATLLNPTTLVYTDVDGDAVTVKVSKGDLTGAFTTAAVNTGITDAEQLLQLNLLGSEFSGASITVTAEPTGEGGDGFVNIGFINAIDTALGKVKVDGDLAKIVVGDVTKRVAISSLEVQSMGVYGTFTGASDLHSVITGEIKTLKVKGDLNSVELEVKGDLKKLNVDGSLVGGDSSDEGAVTVDGALSKAFIAGNVVGTTARSGLITATDGIGSISIGGNVIGGAAANSGFIGLANKVSVSGDVVGGTAVDTGIVGGKSVSIKGSLVGGTADRSGQVLASDGASISIGRDVHGGAGIASGAIFSNMTDIKSVAVVGDFRGGDGNFSGAIVTGDVKSGVSIKGSVIGGEGIFSGFIAADAIKKVSIDGSIIGRSGFLAEPAGGVYAELTIGSITVKGSVDGSYGRSVIVAGGAIGEKDSTIGKVSIGGDVSSLDILAGYRIDPDGSFDGYNGDASIGSVKVGGNWIGGDITAGVETTSSSGFLPTETSIIPGSASNVNSRIGSVTISGQAGGYPGAFFTTAIVAQQQDGLSSIKVGKKTYNFDLPSEIVPIGATFYPATGAFNFLAYMEA